MENDPVKGNEFEHHRCGPATAPATIWAALILSGTRWILRRCIRTDRQRLGTSQSTSDYPSRIRNAGVTMTGWPKQPRSRRPTWPS